jgi:hypothetical protein
LSSWLAAIERSPGLAGCETAAVATLEVQSAAEVLPMQVAGDEPSQPWKYGAPGVSSFWSSPAWRSPQGSPIRALPG